MSHLAGTVELYRAELAAWPDLLALIGASPADDHIVVGAAAPGVSPLTVSGLEAAALPLIQLALADADVEANGHLATARGGTVYIDVACAAANGESGYNTSLLLLDSLLDYLIVVRNAGRIMISGVRLVAAPIQIPTTAPKPLGKAWVFQVAADWSVGTT